MQNRTHLVIALMALMLIACAPDTAAQQKKTRPSAIPAQAAKTAVQIMAYPSPKGIYVFCGMAIASKKHPAADTVGFRIERRTGAGAWTLLTETGMVDDYAALAARVGDSILARTAKVMKAPSAAAIWDTILAKPSLTRVPFISSLPAMLALGTLHLDANVVKGEKYQYRVSTLLRSGEAVKPHESAVVEAGRKWAIGAMDVLSSETTDSSVFIEWWIREVKPWPHLFRVYRRLAGQEEYKLLPRPGGLSKRHDSLVCSFYDRDLIRNQEYDYYIIPEDFVENAGPHSQTASVFTINRTRLPLPQHLRARRDAFGVRLSWSTMGRDYVMATRIYRSIHFDSGYVKIAEVPSIDTAYLDDGVRGMIRYYYRMTNLSYDNKESQHSATVFGYWISTVPPAAPQQVRAVPVKNGVQITWDASPGPDIAGYHVYRMSRVSDSAGVLISRLVTDVTYLDSSNALSGLTEYRYAVEAVNTSQLRSNRSIEVRARPLIATSPKPPRMFTARASGGRIHLAWNDPREYDESVVGYVIYRGETNPAKPLAVLARRMFEPDVTTYIDSAVVPGVDYLYTVASVDAVSAEGLQSAGAAARIVISLPPPPARIHASKAEKGVLLEWDGVDDPAIVSWVIYRNERGKKPEKLFTLQVKDRVYTDAKTKEGTVYYYSVSSVDRDGREGKPSKAAYVVR